MPHRSPLLVRAVILLIAAPLVLTGCSSAGDPVEASTAAPRPTGPAAPSPR